MGGERYQDPPAPPPLAPETRVLVEKHFPPADHERVLAALSTYGARWFEREHDRVGRAIIALAHGSADEAYNAARSTCGLSAPAIRNTFEP
jgi:hypothetical protein